MADKFQSFDDYVNEAKLTTKRKYTLNSKVYDQQTVGSYAPVRTKILSFIKEKGNVSSEILEEFLYGLKEDLGKKPAINWFSRNSDLLKKSVNENDEVVYSLSRKGEKVLAAHLKHESLKEKEGEK